LDWVSYDSDVGRWVGPFLMAALNTRVVRRSNALQDWAHGRRFRYRKVTGFGTSPAAAVQAAAFSAALKVVVRGAGEQPFAFARGEAAPGHHGEVLAGFQLPEFWFHGAAPHLVVVAAARMLHPPPGSGGGRELVQAQGPFRRAGAVPAGVFGQWCQQPELGVGAGEGLLTDLTRVGEHGLAAAV
jgi:hypothetical protein